MLAITLCHKSWACYGVSKWVFGIQPIEAVTEFALAHLPPQWVESFRFLRTGKGVGTGFSHLSFGGFFSCSGSKPIVCYPTWHAWCVKVSRMMETNVDSQLWLLSSYAGDRVLCSFSDNLRKIRCVGLNLFHGPTLPMSWLALGDVFTSVMERG